jgi:hypothetical protein
VDTVERNRLGLVLGAISRALDGQTPEVRGETLDETEAITKLARGCVIPALKLEGVIRVETVKGDRLVFSLNK